LQKLDQQKLHKEALMTEKEVPSWLKYEEEKQVSAGQVRFVFTRSGAHLCCSHNHALAWLVFSERRLAHWRRLLPCHFFFGFEAHHSFFLVNVHDGLSLLKLLQPLRLTEK